jgi:hypothetical protein
MTVGAASIMMAPRDRLSVAAGSRLMRCAPTGAETIPVCAGLSVVQKRGLWRVEHQSHCCNSERDGPVDAAVGRVDGDAR